MRTTLRAVGGLALCGAATAKYLSRDRIPCGMDLKDKKTVALSRHDRDLLHMECYPSLTTVDFYEIDDEDTGVPALYLEDRVRDIVAANPWLAGRLVRKEGATMIAYDADVRKESSVDVRGCKVFQMVDGDTCDFGLHKGYSELPVILEAVGASVPKGGLIIGKDEPVFRVSVISKVSGPNMGEADDYGHQKKKFAVVISMAHCIGDGSTFYSVRNMLSRKEKIKTLDNSRKPSIDDKIETVLGAQQTRYKTPVLANLLFHQLKTLWKANDTSVLKVDVDQDWIVREKAAYLYELSSSSSLENDTDSRPAFLSTNDILTHWFFKFSSPMLAVMTVNMRGKVPDVSHELSGNYVREIPFCARDYDSPALIRKAVERLHRAASPPTTFPTIWEALGRKVGIITNLCTFYKEMELEGCRVIEHLPVYDLYHEERVNEVSHLAIVYRPREGETSLLMAFPKNELELYAESRLGLIDWGCVGSITYLR